VESSTIFSHKVVELFFVNILPTLDLLSTFLSLGRGGGKNYNSNKFWISFGENCISCDCYLDKIFQALASLTLSSFACILWSFLAKGAPSLAQ
jgi:hypothetical protein